jgi:hypothetical protein
MKKTNEPTNTDLEAKAQRSADRIHLWRNVFSN